MHLIIIDRFHSIFHGGHPLFRVFIGIAVVSLLAYFIYQLFCDSSSKAAARPQAKPETPAPPPAP